MSGTLINKPLALTISSVSVGSLTIASTGIASNKLFALNTIANKISPCSSKDGHCGEGRCGSY